MLSQEEYERISEEDMETLSENLGALCEEVGNEKWEVDYSVRRQAGLVDELKAETRLVWCSHPIDTATRHIRAEQTTAKSANMDLVPGPSRFGYIAADAGGADDELRGAWTHFRRPGVTLGGMVEGELRVLGVGKSEGEEWLGVGIK
jgi:frataxin